MPRSKVNPYTEDDVAEVLDNPEWTEEDFARARPFPEVFPEIAKRLRGTRAQKPAKKLVKVADGRRSGDSPIRHYVSPLDDSLIGRSLGFHYYSLNSGRRLRRRRTLAKDRPRSCSGGSLARLR